jgi:hypothetical protein
MRALFRYLDIRPISEFDVLYALMQNLPGQAAEAVNDSPDRFIVPEAYH